MTDHFESMPGMAADRKSRNSRTAILRGERKRSAFAARRDWLRLVLSASIAATVSTAPSSGIEQRQGWLLQATDR